MKRILVLFALFTSILQAAPIIINHTALPLFEQIPDSFLVRAAQTRLLFQHASVGGTIGMGASPTREPEPSSRSQVVTDPTRGAPC